MWNLQGKSPLLTLSGHGGGLNWAAIQAGWPFHCDGRCPGLRCQNLGRPGSRGCRPPFGWSRRLSFVCGVYPDTKYVMTAGTDRSVRIWDAATGEEVRNFVVVTPIPCGWRLIVQTASTSLRQGRTRRLSIWDAATGAQLMLLVGHAKLIASAMYSPDGKTVVTAPDRPTLECRHRRRDSSIRTSYDGQFCSLQPGWYTARHRQCRWNSKNLECDR